MTRPLKLITVFMLTLLTSSLLFTGCSRHPQPAKETMTSEASTPYQFPMTMYVKEEMPGFQKGASVTVLSLDGPLAITQEGEIPFANLEQQRSSFRLTIHSLDAATIRILNIKPKYDDGMWLSPGKYHIEVSKPGYQTYKKWIVIYNDKELNIKLNKSVFAANGSVTWQKKRDTFSSDGLVWYNLDSDEKMTWQTANEFCDNLSITTYGFNIKGFSLPNDSELLQLAKNRGAIEYQNAIYWSSTTDADHQSYAKYVNLNTSEHSWYKKHGKTYVICRHHVEYSRHLSVQQLASALIGKTTHRDTSLIPIENGLSDNERALNAFEMALFIKYGDPLVQNVVYDADKSRLVFELVSQNRTAEGKPLYRREITLEVGKNEVQRMQKQLMDPAFEPIVEFEIINGQLNFVGI